TFDRRFRSLTGSAPLQWLITQRVLQAQRLLETSDYSVDEVASRCGFRSPVALRGHFRRQLGSSPAAYRAAYRARRPQAERPTDPEPSVGPPAPPGPPPSPYPDSGPVPLQTRRTPAPSTLGATASLSVPGENGREAYATSRASLPGQRSGS
ncbi:helix-turn-helix domain-containing protein, partial [Streptomyces sp. NPDC048581]|uniref:helix-turn-helix domain-containing protein n=1 Tax=Streptomyces sp. NPDC048581 TaxID=3365572 RepID=UPI00371B9C07